MFIEIKGAKKQYGTGEAAVYALDCVDFSLEKGKICVILGPSGSGKSTLLNMIGGLDTLDSGEITVDGQRITSLSKKTLTAYRKQSVGFIFQFYILIPRIALGTAAAYGVMAWYCAEFSEVESIIIPTTLYPQSILYTALITAASYLISLLLLRRKVDCTDMIEALKDGRE